MSVADREITLDGEEIEEIRNTDKSMVIQRYINGDLTELSIEVRS